MYKSQKALAIQERPKYSKYMAFYTQNGALITLSTMAIWLGYTDNVKA